MFVSMLLVNLTDSCYCNLEFFIPSFKNTPRITADVGTTTSNLLQKQIIHLHKMFFFLEDQVPLFIVCVCACVLWGLLLPALLPWCPVGLPSTKLFRAAFRC